ncbi:MAG TPA: hypothetical protein PKU78_06510, partial [Candidatus Dojkabacteria bacterium]|nr:hypothetical protein [Candidatus Dojkabacteria bacterium]
GQKGVQLKNENFDFSFWKNPELLVVDASKNTVYQENRIGNLLSVTGEIAHYKSFNNVVDEFKIIDYGIENNIIINQFNANWEVNGAKKVSFKQFIELPYGTKIIDINGTQKTTDFSSELFALEFPSGEKVFFNPLITFDNNANKKEAKLFYGVEENKVPEDLKAKATSFYKGNYRVAFVEGGIEIYADVDLNWLKNAQFPVVVDPTATVGSTVSGSYYGPMTHWYGFQRYATLYLQSEIGGYGTISQIEYYKTGTEVLRTKPTWVYMRNNTNATLTSTAAWNSTDYTSGATICMNNVNTTQDAAAGWKALSLGTSHNYSTGNLQVMVKDIYGGSGSAQYMAQQTLANRQTYRRADGTDPGEASVMTAESNFTTVRITYTPACTPSGDPSVFGNNVWNIYAWNAGDANGGSGAWSSNYSGYYTRSTLNYNSQSDWSSSGSPSDASGWQGTCTVGIDNHSWSAKRQGFPCDKYQINIPAHD